MSQGRRDEFAHFGWDPDDVPDPQDVATFDRSKLRWEEVDEPMHAGLLAWHRELIALRRRIAALSDPRLDRVAVEVDEDRRILAVARGPVRVLVNLGPADHCFCVASDGATSVLTASDPGVRSHGTNVVVPPDAVAIVQVGDA